MNTEMLGEPMLWREEDRLPDSELEKSIDLRLAR